jgi:hypothetical protein
MTTKQTNKKLISFAHTMEKLLLHKVEISVTDS